MAVYVPAAKIAVEIVDDPTSLPADLDAFPGFTVVPITRADLRDPSALDHISKRIARAAGATGKQSTDVGREERRKLVRLINMSLELNQRPLSPRGDAG